MNAMRAIMPYLIAVLVLGGGFYALVIYPYTLDDLVKGAIIGMMSTAISFVFGQEIAKATASSTTKALNAPAPGQAPPDPPRDGPP